MSALEISVKRGDYVDKVLKLGHSNCRRGNITVVVHANHVIFAHVNTPLFGSVSLNGGSGIDIVPVLTKDPAGIIKANQHNPFITVGTKLTGEVS